MTDPAVEQWRDATRMSTGAQLRAALEANAALAVENERLRAQIRHRPGPYWPTAKAYAALQPEENTMPDLDPELVETVSAAVHDQWMTTKHAQGVTGRQSETGEELMVPYGQLSEAAKDLDRGSVKATLNAIFAAGYRITPTAEDRARLRQLIAQGAPAEDQP